MRRVLLLFACLALAAAVDDWDNWVWGVNDVGCIQGNIPTVDENAPKHLQWARFLLDRILDGTGNTTYDHYAGPIWWGQYSCNTRYTSVSDCNGFTSAFFKQAYNLTIDSPEGQDHAYASTYWHAFVDQAYGFQRIRRVQDIKEGDTIAYNYLYQYGRNDTAYLGTQNSGHIALVTKVPYVATSSAPFIDDTIQWAVPIIDQTSDPHYTTDSRYSAKATGLGTGTMRLYTSASNGSFVGYAWSFSPSTKFYYNDVIRSPAVGRYTLEPASGCGVSITQELITSWEAGWNPSTPYTQWSVTVKTSSKRVNSLKLLIVNPAGADFSSWQIQAVPGEPGHFTIMDWHFSAGSSLPQDYQFNFGYTVSSASQSYVYVATTTC